MNRQHLLKVPHMLFRCPWMNYDIIQICLKKGDSVLATQFSQQLNFIRSFTISLLTNAWAKGTVRRIFSIKKLYVAGALKCKQHCVKFRSVTGSKSSLFFLGMTYLHKPKGILWNSHNPRFVLNAVLCLSSFLIGTVWNAPALEWNMSSGYLWSVTDRLESIIYRHFYLSSKVKHLLPPRRERLSRISPMG